MLSIESLLTPHALRIEKRFWNIVAIRESSISLILNSSSNSKSVSVLYLDTHLEQL